MIAEIATDRELLVIEDHGIYIPKLFCESVKPELKEQGLQEEGKICRRGPRASGYKEAWSKIVERFRYPSVFPGEWVLEEEEGGLWARRLD